MPGEHVMSNSLEGVADPRPEVGDGDPGVVGAKTLGSGGPGGGRGDRMEGASAAGVRGGDASFG